MHLKRLTLQNVRSFKERVDLSCDGPITILIGPNGSGKTNLLDAAVIMLRRYLFASMYPIHTPTAEQPDRYEFRHNDALNQLTLERHSSAADLPQILEIEIEVTKRDVEAITRLKADANEIVRLAGSKYVNLRHSQAAAWDLTQITAGKRLTYRIENGGFSAADPDRETANHFHQFLQIYEMDSQIREEFDLAALSTPMIYLPVNRSANAISSSVELAGYNAFEQKRHSDASISRTNFSLVQVAIGRLAQRYRLLLEKDAGDTQTRFKSDPSLVQLTAILRKLGYEWELVCTNPLRNAYDIQLSKQGSRFLVSRASSGERELLTYLFTIFALNVRDALILVDEPELHLHPRWQSILLELFEELARETGNQFLFATHSPTFVSPKSIRYVSRIYSFNQSSNVVQLDVSALPNGRHLLNSVNSHNNEKVFFADLVILVEGITDRMFFESVIDRLRTHGDGSVYEIVSVGGKGMFATYQSILEASKVPYVTIADLDYIEQVGTEELKGLFALNAKEIKDDVIDNTKSLDGNALVTAIDRAILNGQWGDAAEVWEYIKGRRRVLNSNLSDEDTSKLQTFLADKRREGLFILSQGALEQYLPSGHRSKDMSKLIDLLAADDFLDRLPATGLAELREIVRCIFDPTQRQTQAPTTETAQPELA